MRWTINIKYNTLVSCVTQYPYLFAFRFISNEDLLEIYNKGDTNMVVLGEPIDPSVVAAAERVRPRSRSRRRSSSRSRSASILPHRLHHRQISLDFLASSTEENDLANQMNALEVQFQETILRDIQTSGQAAGQQVSELSIPASSPATANENEEQFDQLIPEAQAQYLELQKSGAYNLRVIRESPNVKADNFCYMTHEDAFPGRW